MNIKGKFVTLRAQTKEDMKLICDMFNDPELEKCVVGWAFPLSLEQQNKWFDNNIGDQKNHRFIIETIEDGAVGIVALTNIDWKNRTACQGIKLLNNKVRNKGIGTDTLMAIQRYAFDQLGLHRLNATRFSDNVASEKLHNKCGWKNEGIQRECVYKNGKWKDLIVMGLLESDYRETEKRMRYWES